MNHFDFSSIRFWICINANRSVLLQYLTAASVVLLLASCGNEEKCSNVRSFSSSDFQQTWFTSVTPSAENLGAVFGDADGSFFEPVKIDHFDYCVQGMTIYISFGYLWKERQTIEIVKLDKEIMTLRFPNGAIFTYYRAGK